MGSGQPGNRSPGNVSKNSPKFEKYNVHHFMLRILVKVLLKIILRNSVFFGENRLKFTASTFLL